MNTRSKASTPISRGRQGINMSQIINQATNLRSARDGGQAKNAEDKFIDRMALGNFSALHDFAQD